MASNYTQQLARDKNGVPLQEYPAPIRPQTRYSSENASASSVISFTHDTTAIEIAAVGGPAVMRWVTTSDTQASVVSAAGGNFDHVIPTATYRRFVVPIESAGLGGSSVVGINREAGLYQRVAVKSIGTASVLTIEY